MYFAGSNCDPGSTRGGRTAGQAWAKYVGWRIDYQVATRGIAATAHTATIYQNRRFSDHAPLIIDYDYELRCARKNHPCCASPTSS